MLAQHWKKSTLLILIIIGPWGFSVLTTSCDKESPIYEVVDQEILVLEEGNYTEVIITLHFQLREVGTAWILDSNSFWTPLYAFTPEPPTIVNKVIGLNITGSSDYSENFPSGSELISLFRITDSRYSQYELTYPKTLFERDLFLFLKEAPDDNLSTTLTIATTFDNGLMLVSESPPVSITR